MTTKTGLGGGFNRLWMSAIFTNFGDGVSRMAVPLAAAALTRDPLAIAVLTALAVLPWLAFGVFAGVLVDRHDRRVLLAAANALRALAAVGLIAAFALDVVTLWMLAAAIVVFGLGEVLADNATNAILPSVVSREQLDKANGRIQAAQVGIDSFVATPLAGVLFSVTALLPFVVSLGSFAAVVVFALALPVSAARAARQGAALAADARAGQVEAHAKAPRTKAPRVEAREGLAYLWGHAWLRPMVLLTTAVAAFLTFAQAGNLLLFLDTWSVPEAALGLVVAGAGVGGLAGALLAPAIVARWGRARTMQVGMGLAGAGLGAVAFAPNLGVALAMYAVGSAGVGIWNVPWGSVRQEIIPGELLGRVLGVARTIGWSLIPIATILGGLVARQSLTLPWAIGGIAVVVLTVAAWRLVGRADAVAAQYRAEGDIVKSAREASSPALT